MSGSGWETLPDVREWSGRPPGCPGVLGRPCRMYGSGGSPSRMTGSGWEALPHVREWSVGPPECWGVVGRPSQMSGSGQVALTGVWKY